MQTNSHIHINVTNTHTNAWYKSCLPEKSLRLTGELLRTNEAYNRLKSYEYTQILNYCNISYSIASIRLVELTILWGTERRYIYIYIYRSIFIVWFNEENYSARPRWCFTTYSTSTGLHSETRDDECREEAIEPARTRGPTPSERTRGVARLHVRAALPVLSIPTMKLRSHEERTKRYCERREQCRASRRAEGQSRQDSRGLTIVRYKVISY